MRIKELDNADFETLIEATAIRYRVKCDDLNKKIIIQDLRNEMGMFKVEDFNLAISKHVTGKFAISTNEANNRPYGDLSSQFLCQVLNGYKEFVRKANMNKKQLPSNVLLIPEGKKTEEQIEKEQKEAFDFIENEFKQNGKLPKTANWNDAFFHMEKVKILNYSNDEKQMFKDNVIYNIETQLKANKALKKMCNALNLIISNDGLLKCECRKRMIIKHYENSNNNIVKKDL